MTGSMHVWITGGGSGIGAATAQQLAAAGHRVVISGRDPHKLNAVAASEPGLISPLICDVRDADEMKRAAQQIADEKGYLDVVVLCAGCCEYVDVDQLDVSLFQRVFAVNVEGVVNTVAAALPLLRKSPHQPYSQPLIVGVSSLSTVVAMTRAEAYGASKAAMRYLLESLRVDLAQEQIEVSVVSPGFVKTPLVAENDFDMPFMVTAEEAAQQLVRVIVRRPLHHSFPRRLAWPLQLFAALPAFWFRWLGPKLARQRSLIRSEG